MTTAYADATDKTVDTFKQGTKAVSDRFEFLATLPSLDFVEPVERYFDYLFKAVELNREIATRWAELVSQLTGTFRDEAIKAGHSLEEQLEGAADKAGEVAHKTKDVADKAIDQGKQVVDEATDKAGDIVDETVDKTREATDEAADAAEDVADDAAQTTKRAASRARRG